MREFFRGFLELGPDLFERESDLFERENDLFERETQKIIPQPFPTH